MGREGAFRIWVILVGVVVACQGCPTREQSAGTPAAPASPYSLGDEALGPNVVVADGPWGRLRVLEFWLAPEEEAIDSSLCGTTYPPWTFPGWSRQDLRAFLAQPGFDQKTRAELDALTTCHPQGCSIAPTLLVAESLSTEARAAIYSVQLRQPDSPWLAATVRRKAGNVASWLEQAGLDESARRQVLALGYPEGDSLAFSDLPLLCSRAADDPARGRLIRAWFFTRALLVKLRVQPQDNITAIEEYWSQERRIDLLPLLRAAAGVEGGMSIDITYLLPATTRRYLNTFPLAGAPPYDCHWTSMNFGRIEPDEGMVNFEGVRERLKSEYDEVPFRNLRKGDVVFWIDSRNLAVHSAVYLAADIFFTKNGRSALQPWVLSWRKDLDRLYHFEGTYRRVYRKRGS